MTCGKLPWGDAARSKEKPKVIELKKKYFDSLDDFMTWEANLSRTLENIKEVSFYHQFFDSIVLMRGLVVNEIGERRKLPRVSTK